MRLALCVSSSWVQFMKTSSSLCTCTKGNVNLPPYHMIFLNILLLTQCSKRLSRYLTTKKKKFRWMVQWRPLSMKQIYWMESLKAFTLPYDVWEKHALRQCRLNKFSKVLPLNTLASNIFSGSCLLVQLVTIQVDMINCYFFHFNVTS